MIAASVGLIVAICAIGAGVFVFARRWSTAMPQIMPPCKMDEAGLIRWLGSYRDWYKKSAKRCERVTMACRIIPNICRIYDCRAIDASGAGSHLFGRILQCDDNSVERTIDLVGGNHDTTRDSAPRQGSGDRSDRVRQTTFMSADIPFLGSSGRRNI